MNGRTKRKRAKAKASGGMCPHESKRLGIDNSAVTPLANRQRPFCGGIPSTEDPNQFILSF